MLNALIEKLMGLTWVVTRTGWSAEVQISDTMRAKIHKRGSYGDHIELCVEHHLTNRFGQKVWSIWSSFDKDENRENLGVCTSWLSHLLTKPQQAAVHQLFNKVVTEGKDDRLSKIVSQM